ncbi:2-hydroxyacid dehydrogenase [Halomonas sp. HAL1]|uniref:2-hydroxyacid dehydrogenase n=1 Tax=Halomonas sp. HAL1 TaxID=550984 RepID=UPI00022D296A|nr:2-hydroxyacid dehydrogenase [Halomonas sp. HAL1]EHA15219.1 D-isomer specific 2-hydroxyacid dehydrogenase, NAD-binding protein [Halomonas sp. HAL1]WKV93217.1 2-hydroxyacid dehydrogenase [Halomonas sp. HAL1]
MSASPVILIGYYSPRQRQQLETRFSTHSIDNLALLHDLPEAVRRTCRSVAYHGHSPFGLAEMNQLPSLELIANFGVGYDDIDINAAVERGIKVTNTPNVLNDDVADLSVGMLLALKRQLLAGDRWVREGEWARRGTFPLNASASGLRVGVLGMGRIGREIADRMAAFKSKVHYQSRSPKDTPSSWQYHKTPLELAAAVDVLFVTVVGGTKTHHLVSADVLNALPDNAVIINVSRGSVIDEKALIEQLESGRLGGAGLDVFDNEPNVNPKLLALNNVILQPHQGSGTVQTREAMGDLQFANLEAFNEKRDLLTLVN